MQPITEFPREIASKITTVFTDIDDTLTTNGRLPASAYDAVERLSNAGIAVVPVTGRPAGWCDMIARFWPVAGVVGENGAFYFSYDSREKVMRRCYYAKESVRQLHREKLSRIEDRVLREVPGCAISADQAYREVDLGIDFCEDVAPLSEHEVLKIKQICEEEGATAKISSIHVNTWFGDFDKLSMSKRFATEILGYDLDEVKHTIVFCGDSPNDAPMFSYFPNSCGVANVIDFADRLEAKPKWISKSKGGKGFVEIVDRLLGG